MSIQSTQAIQYQYSQASVSQALAIAYEEYMSFSPDTNGNITVSGTQYNQQAWQNKRLTDMLVHPHTVVVQSV